MKKLWLLFTAVFALLTLSTTQLWAQEEDKESNFSVGADVYSNYVWRGSKLGNGPSFQPSVKFITGGLTLGVWGAFDAAGYTEADPYISYSFPFGLSLGLTDYYLPGLEAFDFSKSTGSQALELNAGFAVGGLNLSANYILNEAGGVGSTGGDMYFQAGYSFKYFNLFLGAGDGWYTSDGDFNICIGGLGTSKEIKITDTFSVPVTGQVILNPEKEQFYLVVGFSL